MISLKLNFSFLLFLFISISASREIYPQETNIVQYLKEIENGNIARAKDALIDMKEKNPQDPSVMFLDAVLKENGQEAVVIYSDIVDNYPRSKYADASLYRIFSYYYALGLYETAQEKLKQLKINYPESPYIHVAEQSIVQLGKTEEKETKVKTEDSHSEPELEYKYTIQAGAFINIDNAKKLLNEFESSGIYCSLAQKIVGGTTFNVVYAGKFINYEDAQSFLRVVNSRYNLNGSIISFSDKKP